MRKLMIILLLLIFSRSNAQVEKIKIRKDGCNFELVADTSLLGLILRLSKFALIGPIKKRSIEKFRDSTHLASHRRILITHKGLDSLFNKVCIVDKYKLEKIVVEKEVSTIRKDYVVMKFYYSKLK